MQVELLAALPLESRNRHGQTAVLAAALKDDARTLRLLLAAKASARVADRQVAASKLRHIILLVDSWTSRLDPGDANWRCHGAWSSRASFSRAAALAFRSFKRTKRQISPKL